MAKDNQSKRTLIGATVELQMSDGKEQFNIKGIVKSIFSITGSDWWIVVNDEATSLDVLVNPNNIVLITVVKEHTKVEEKDDTDKAIY